MTSFLYWRKRTGLYRADLSPSSTPVEGRETRPTPGRRRRVSAERERATRTSTPAAATGATPRVRLSGLAGRSGRTAGGGRLRRGRTERRLCARSDRETPPPARPGWSPWARDPGGAQASSTRFPPSAPRPRLTLKRPTVSCRSCVWRGPDDTRLDSPAPASPPRPPPSERDEERASAAGCGATEARGVAILPQAHRTCVAQRGVSYCLDGAVTLHDENGICTEKHRKSHLELRTPNPAHQSTTTPDANGDGEAVEVEEHGRRRDPRLVFWGSSVRRNTSHQTGGWGAPQEPAGREEGGQSLGLSETSLTGPLQDPVGLLHDTYIRTGTDAGFRVPGTSHLARSQPS